MMLRSLIRLCLAGVCTFSVGYWVLSAFLVRRRMSRPRPFPGAGWVLEPVTFLRPMKAGIVDLPARLREAVSSMRPGDQLVIGVDAHTAEAAACTQFAEQHRDLPIVVAPCRPGVARNPKVNKLIQMSPAALHDRLILLDSEASPDAVWMERFRVEWKATDADLLTAGYRFFGAKSCWQQLDAAPALLTLWPGVAVVEAFGSLRFALGACMALRRQALAELGGWERYRDLLAEDYALGQHFVLAGRRVVLSREVLMLQSDPLGAGDYWRHQRRAAVTYRVANPAGLAGQIMSHGVTAGLLLLVASGGAAWSWAVVGGVALVRGLTVEAVSRAVGWRMPHFWLAGFVASLLETVFWLGAWISPQVCWAGRWWRVTSDGDLAEIADASSDNSEDPRAGNL